MAISVKILRQLKNNDGLTLKKYESVAYKTGYQVATEGVECKTATAAYRAIQQYDGNCGIWVSEGIYYTDRSMRISTKREAVAVGKQCNQISILKWADMSLIFLKDIS